MKATLISDSRQVIFPMSQMLERIKALAMPKWEEDVVTLSSGGEEVSLYLYQTIVQLFKARKSLLMTKFELDVV